MSNELVRLRDLSLCLSRGKHNLIIPSEAWKKVGQRLSWLLRGHKARSYVLPSFVLEAEPNLKKLRCPWINGSCFTLALVLREILGGEIYVVASPNGTWYHALLKVAPGIYLDARGAFDSGAHTAFWKRKERADLLYVRRIRAKEYRASRFWDSDSWESRRHRGRVAFVRYLSVWFEKQRRSLCQTPSGYSSHHPPASTARGRSRSTTSSKPNPSPTPAVQRAGSVAVRRGRA